MLFGCFAALGPPRREGLGWWKIERPPGGLGGGLGAPTNLRRGLGDGAPKGHKANASLGVPQRGSKGQGNRTAAHRRRRGPGQQTCVTWLAQCERANIFGVGELANNLVVGCPKSAPPPPNGKHVHPPVSTGKGGGGTPKGAPLAACPWSLPSTGGGGREKGLQAPLPPGGGGRLSNFSRALCGRFDAEGHLQRLAGRGAVAGPSATPVWQAPGQWAVH